MVRSMPNLEAMIIIDLIKQTAHVTWAMDNSYDHGLPAAGAHHIYLEPSQMAEIAVNLDFDLPIW